MADVINVHNYIKKYNKIFDVLKVNVSQQYKSTIWKKIQKAYGIVKLTKFCKDKCSQISQYIFIYLYKKIHDIVFDDGKSRLI